MKISARTWILLGLLALLAAVPPLASALNQPFYLDLLRRVMIFGIAAISLNLILGYGGMVSFGHAAYLGIGAYAVGVLSHHGIDNGWLQWAVAIGASALIALAIGAISVRTSGIYFIMITLAFTQMLYYLGISIEEYGGDDGMRLTTRSQFSGLIDLGNGTSFYYLVLAILALFLYLTHRLVHSRFGMALQAARSNEARTWASMRCCSCSSWRCGSSRISFSKPRGPGFAAPSWLCGSGCGAVVRRSGGCDSCFIPFSRASRPRSTLLRIS